jgi:hypothetical protein
MNFQSVDFQGLGGAPPRPNIGGERRDDHARRETTAARWIADVRICPRSRSAAKLFILIGSIPFLIKRAADATACAEIKTPRDGHTPSCLIRADDVQPDDAKCLKPRCNKSLEPRCKQKWLSLSVDFIYSELTGRGKKGRTRIRAIAPVWLIGC